MALQSLLIKCPSEVDQEFRQLLAEQEPQGSGKPVSMGMFLEEMIENWKNPRKIKDPEDQKLISEKSEIIKDLTYRLTEALNKPAELSTEDQERITLLEHENFRLKSEITILKENDPAELANSVIFKITDEEQAQIDDFTVFAKNNYNVDLEPAQSLFFLIRDKKLKGNAY